MKKGEIVRLNADHTNDHHIPWRSGKGEYHDTHTFPAGSIGKVEAVKKTGVRIKVEGFYERAWDVPESAIDTFPTLADGLIAAYRNEFAVAQRNLEASQALWDKNNSEGRKDKWQHRPERARINWDEGWDGKLVERVQKLANIPGIDVTRIYRKQKLCFRLNGMKYTDFVHLLAYVFGDDFPDGVRFKPQAYIWWGTLKSYWH